MDIAIKIMISVVRYLFSVGLTWIFMWAFELEYNIWAVGVVVFIIWNILEGITEPKLTEEQKWNKAFRRKK